jgi:hypothetical protein
MSRSCLLPSPTSRAALRAAHETPYRYMRRKCIALVGTTKTPTMSTAMELASPLLAKWIQAHADPRSDPKRLAGAELIKFTDSASFSAGSCKGLRARCDPKRHQPLSPVTRIRPCRPACLVLARRLKARTRKYELLVAVPTADPPGHTPCSPRLLD